MGYVVDHCCDAKSSFPCASIWIAFSRERKGFQTCPGLGRIPTGYRVFITEVHDEIRSLATLKKANFKSETVVKEVERLINVHRFKPSERFISQGEHSGLARIIVAVTFAFRLFVLYGNIIFENRVARY